MRRSFSDFVWDDADTGALHRIEWGAGEGPGGLASDGADLQVVKDE